MVDKVEAKKIDVPQVRIGLYNCRRKIYYGEITFFHWRGKMPFNHVEWDLKLGKMIKLPCDK